jgi:hypothetical protein
LPIATKVLFCTQEANSFGYIVYCQELCVLQQVLLQTYRGQLGKPFGVW